MLGMKLRVEKWFRAYLLVLGAALLWCGWAMAATNESGQATNRTPVLVEEVTKFQDSYLTFGLDRITVLREHRFLATPLWKYLASLIYMLLAFYLAKVVDWLAAIGLRRVVSRTQTVVDDVLIQLLHGPLKVVIFAVLLIMGLNILAWSERIKSYLSRALILIVAIAVTYLGVKSLCLLLQAWKRRIAHQDKKFNDQLFGLMSKSVTAFLVIVAVLLTAQNLGINMTAAIASFSIGGLAVGLAAQDTLANLFGAVAVLTDKPFQVGDQIRLDGAEGTVEIIGLRSTRVRNTEGHLVSVPNRVMGNAIVTNITRRPTIKTVINLTLPRTMPADKLRRALELLREAYCEHPNTEDAWVNFNQFAGPNLNILINHWWKGTDYRQYLAGIEEMNLRVKQRFDAEGIPFS
jgi:MscS family membrane protein